MCERSRADHEQNRPPRLKTLHGLLQERFPQAFPKNYDDLRPLKTGILADLIARLPGFDPTALRRTLANHASRDGYLLALLHGRGDRRYDLDGQPAGTVTVEERVTAAQRLAASQQRQQAKAERVRTHQAREAQRRQQREIERRNREEKARRKAEHERRRQEAAARKAAPGQTVSRDTKSERFRPRPVPLPAQPGPQDPATAQPTSGRPPVFPDGRPEQPLDQARIPPAKPMPQVEYKKRRTIPLDSHFGPKNDGKEDRS